MLLRTALVVALALMAVSARSAAAAETVTVGAVGPVAGMSAWHGHVVFSQLDPPTSRWHLMEATRTGIRALPVPAKAEAFSADVGPDAHGRPTAVYAQCSGRTVTPPPRCHIDELALAGAGARPHLVRALLRRGYSDTGPSIWRGRIAFGRTLLGYPQTFIAAMFVQRRPGARVLVRLARGSVPRCGARDCFRLAQPAQSDLGPQGLALVWWLTGGDAIPQDDHELWRIPSDGGAGTLLDVGISGECGMGSSGDISAVGFESPSLDGRHVDYLRVAGDCWPTQSAFVRTGPSPLRQRRHVVGGDHLAYAMARDGRRFWWVRGAPLGPDASTNLPCAASPCTLMLSSHVRFHAVRVRRRPVPPIDPALRR